MQSDECVRVWRGRLGASWSRSWHTFKGFYDEALAENSEFVGLSPSELVEWQVRAVGRDRYKILLLAQDWLNRQPLRYNTKVTRLSSIRSFFMHNHAELPRDGSFQFKSDVPAVDGNLPYEDFKRILLNCNKMYRVVFLMMGNALLDEAGLLYVNEKYCDLILESLTKNAGIFKLSLPGRKRNRNIKDFYTMLSTRSDWLMR